MSAWRPIETAPKDGTRVLVWALGDVFLASFGYDIGDGSAWQPEYAEVPMFDDPDSAPTHWMPLPEPPMSL